MNNPENPQSNKERMDMEKVIKVRKAIYEAFQVLKEYSAGLSDAESRKLAGYFTGEPDEYFQVFFEKIRKAKPSNK